MKSFNNSSIQGQLTHIMDQFEKNQSTKSSSATPSVLTVNLDFKTNLISWNSNDLAENGQPLEQYQLNKKTGVMTTTTRSRDGSEVRVKTDVING